MTTLELVLVLAPVLINLYQNIKLANQLKELQEDAAFDRNRTMKHLDTIDERIRYFEKRIGEHIGITNLLIKKGIITEEEFRQNFNRYNI